jgi:hypothetical protein
MPDTNEPASPSQTKRQSVAAIVDALIKEGHKLSVEDLQQMQQKVDSLRLAAAGDHDHDHTKPV